MNNKKTAAACLLCCLLLTGCGKGKESSVTGAVVTMQTGSSTTAAQNAETTTQAAGAENSSAGNDGTQNAGQENSDSQGEQTGENSSAAETGAIDLVLHAPSAIPDDGTLPVTISLPENPGIDLIAVRLYYEESLDAVGTDIECTYTDGPVTDGFLSTCALNRTQRIVGYVAYGAETTGASGDVFTCQFRLPETVKSGDSFTFRWELVQCTASGKDLEAGPFTETVTMK